jgi:magnesium chelatase family protein
MGSKLLAKHCALDEETRDRLKQAFEQKKLSARSYDRILRVARTVADLEGRERILREHLVMALRLRELDTYLL